MAGIKRLDKNPIILNYIWNQLLRPNIKQVLFDDWWGGTEIYLLLQDPRTLIYGIMEAGKPEPVGVVYFTGTVPYRDCFLAAVIFEEEKRDKGLITAQVERIKADMVNRFAIHSVTAHVTGDNKGSKKLLERLGFQKIGVKPKAIRAGGRYQDTTIYYLLLGAKEDQNGTEHG